MQPASKKEQIEDDDEPDEWDVRINKTGCADENMALTDCYQDTKDWRKCTDEMKAFKDCWAAHKQDDRTKTKQM
ncbi:Cytochrome oxidase assembly factor 4 [Yarrowia sp. C11]|nr:Cytochrome oxidase assembly factor 4 [Yarrowia sp. C11]KAG5371063.1 Cytochrome oxidase assembly factor 4 [Yarrowia sp. E02]